MSGNRRAALLLHVGYHKTGTTWLQQGLFRDTEVGFEQPWRSMETRPLLVLPNRLDWGPQRAMAAFAPALEAAAARGRVAVLSDERLSGSPHAGGYDSAEIAERLAAVFPEARVLVVVREQARAVYSVYQQYVRNGGAASLRRYLEPRRVDEVPQFRWEHYEYDRLVGHYQELFGADRVLVLAFEQLAADPQGFLLRIAEHAGLPPPAPRVYAREYPALQALTIRLKVWFDRMFVRTALNPGALFYVKSHERKFERLDRLLPAALSRPLERRWRAHLDRAAAGRFEESNARTASLTGLDLRRLGYAMPREPAQVREVAAKEAGSGLP